MSVSPAQEQPEQPAPFVNVTRFVPALRQGDRKIWHLTFRYSFPRQNRVVLAGIGVIAPQGRLSYLTDQTELRFLNEHGNVLQVIPLERTGTPEGAGIELPSPTDFPDAYVSYGRKRPFLPNECDTVLNQFFTSGYRMRVESKTTFYTTAFQAVKEGVSPNKRIRIALQISNPYPAPRGQIAFRTQMVVRERGRGDDKDAASVSDSTQDAAARFRARVLSKLQAVP